jgi:hypothetical protein
MMAGFDGSESRRSPKGETTAHGRCAGFRGKNASAAVARRLRKLLLGPMCANSG